MIDEKKASETDAVKREAEQTLDLPTTTSGKMEQRLAAPTTGELDTEESHVEPEDDQGEKRRFGGATPGETLEKMVQQAGLGEGPRRGS